MNVSYNLSFWKPVTVVLVSQVLDDFSLSVRAQQKVALVGPSGCGKSTCLHLIQRFYNVDDGGLTMDGGAVADINVPHLRSHIGLVSQARECNNSLIFTKRHGRKLASQEDIGGRVSRGESTIAHETTS